MKHRLTTWTVFVVIVLIAVPFTDGVMDSWKDVFMLNYPLSMAWVWLRLAGFLTFKK